MTTPIRHPTLGWVLQNADGTYEPLAPAEQAEWDVLERTLKEVT